MKRTIIAISSKITGGKSTLANAICQADPRFSRLSLADPLKDDIAQLCEVSREHIEANKDRYRPILQYYGTDIMRVEHGPDYWVIRLVDKMRDFNLMDVVVDDCRFPNELEGLRKAADVFLGVRLNITDKEQERRCTEKFGAPLSYAKLIHPSETALDGHLDKFDLQLDADMPTEAQVRSVLMMLKDRGGAR